MEPPGPAPGSPAAWPAAEASRPGAAAAAASGLLRGSGQLFELAAVAHLQGAPRGLAELGVQGAAEVADPHVRQGVQVDNDPLVGDQSLVRRSHIPPSPPEVGANLNFQVSVRFDIVQLLSPRHRLLGPELRVWLLLGRLDGGVLPGGRHVVPAQGRLLGLWVASLGPDGESSAFRLMEPSRGPGGCSLRPAGPACSCRVLAHLLGLHWRVPYPCPGSQGTWGSRNTGTSSFWNMGTGGCRLLVGLVPLRRASAKNVRTLSGGGPGIGLLCAPGGPSKMGLWGPLPHTCRLGLGARLVFPGLCVHTARSPLGLLQGTLAVSLGRSRGLPGSPELGFQRLQRGVRHCRRVLGLLLLAPRCGRPRLGRRIH